MRRCVLGWVDLPSWNFKWSRRWNPGAQGPLFCENVQSALRTEIRSLSAAKKMENSAEKDMAKLLRSCVGKSLLQSAVVSRFL